MATEAGRTPVRCRTEIDFENKLRNSILSEFPIELCSRNFARLVVVLVEVLFGCRNLQFLGFVVAVRNVLQQHTKLSAPFVSPGLGPRALRCNFRVGRKGCPNTVIPERTSGGRAQESFVRSLQHNSRVVEN